MQESIGEEEYDFLCQECDSFLKKGPNELSRKANSWLHIIREHPIFIKSYFAIFKKGDVSFALFLFRKIIQYMFFGGLKFIHSLYRNIIRKEQLKIINSSFDYMILSHLLNKDFLNRQTDFYFHELPQKFQHQGGKVLMVYINYIGEVNHLIEKKWKSNEIDKLVLPRYLSTREELKIRALLICGAFKILSSASNGKRSRRIKFQAAIESLSPASHFNLRLGFQIKQIVKKTKAKQLFTTFEGHPWERIAFVMARKSNPKIKCVAYQHALIFRKQYAITRSLGINYNPDFILCSGKDGQEKLKKANLISKDKIICFGSNRTATALENIPIKIKQKRDTVLMLAEGDLIEVLPLIDFFYELSKLHKLLRFIIRFHPITSIKKVLKARKYLNQLPSNLIFSQCSFEEDLSRADFAIYRGSTSIIKAIQYGLVPVYVKRPNEMSIDILYKFPFLRYEISNPKEFDHKVLNSFDEFDEKILQLSKEVNQFFSPLNYDEALKINPTV